MMKKAFLFLLLLLLTFRMALLCYASEALVNDKDDVVIGDIFAKYVCIPSWNEVVVTNGMAETETNAGYTISVSGAPKNATRLIVFQITSIEESAWNWLSSCMDEDYTLLNAFDIYFEDSDENRIYADDAQICIKKCDTACVVLAINTDGQSARLNATNSNNSISFSANGSNYYVLVAMNVSTAPTEPDKTVSPSTGDNSQILLWCLLAAASGYCAYGGSFGTKKIQNSING